MKIPQKLATAYIRLKLKLLTVLSKKRAAQKAFELFSTPFVKKMRRSPSVFKTAELLDFNFNGLNIHGYHWNRSKPNKVLIIHGFSSQAYKFKSYVERLITKKYEVVAFDAPAHGSSEGKTLNALEYSEVIKKIIELYGPFTGFIAHSFGAIALSLALENTPHDKNTKVVFIAPATETTTSIRIALKFLRVKNEAVKKEINNIVYRLSGKDTQWFSIKRAMENISASVLWIHDEDDEITPLEDALCVQNENFQNVTFFITKGLGHRKIYHDRDIKKRVIDFL
ncbi:MAG: alpha/beta fold hydrolase [Ferruginibacter sp.]